MLDLARFRGPLVALGLFTAALTGACGHEDVGTAEVPSGADEPGGAGGETGGGDADALIVDNPVAKPLFVNNVQPLLAAQCGSCHLGKRFSFASLARAGAQFTSAESESNYRDFLKLISLDQPTQSRLLAKMVAPSSATGMLHGGGVVATPTDAIYQAALTWIKAEKAARCPDCGTTAPVSYLAYVEEPRLFWAIPDEPIRNDHGLRDRAYIKLRKLDPVTGSPGPAIDFLGNSFCGADGHCDFGHLAANHAGTQLAFECRLSLQAGQDWVNDVRWNVCLADIGSDGKAVNPRFLMPAARQHHGAVVSRSDPFGITINGGAAKGSYDLHFMTRRRGDRGPVFSPDDARLYLSSKGPDPRTGVAGTQAYHGVDFLDNIVSVALDGSDPRSIYLNEGGVADLPFFLRNGNVAFHTWNLERMDRHMYTQATADGMAELPVLMGRVQGPNMWGRAVQLANGGIFGVTGRRRSSITNYVPFFADHTLGTGLDSGIAPFRILDPATFAEVLDFPGGYCNSPEGTSCFTHQYYADPAYSPDGRAYLAHNPGKTYVLQGEDMYLMYAKGNTNADKVASMLAYTPQKLGISLMNKDGQVQRVLDPPSGMMDIHPTWVGKRAPELAQPQVTNEGQQSAVLHIANAPIWFSFAHAEGTVKANAFGTINKMVSLRVLVKSLGGNLCLSDARPYRYAVNDGNYDHPTHLGRNNATGYERLVAPASAGGDAFGDVKLQPDGSVKIKVPAGKLLFFQGVDAAGHVVTQRDRLLSLPPGQTVDASVPTAQYRSQCLSCHGSLDTTTPFQGLTQTNQIPLVALDYTASAAFAKPAVDLTASPTAPVHFLGAVRPLLDAKCVSCHSGNTPGGELSLEAHYSDTGNYPKGKWATVSGLADPAYLSFVPVAKRVPAYNYSLSYAWNFKEDETVYTQSSNYQALIQNHAPLGKLAPWDPAYQNLAAPDNSTGPHSFRYLSGWNDANFGRGDRGGPLGGISGDSGLIELLTGQNIDPRHDFLHPSVTHTGILTDLQIRTLMAVLDAGYSFMSRCDDRIIPASGTPSPNGGKPWGDP
jgi:hypothetical protein